MVMCLIVSDFHSIWVNCNEDIMVEMGSQICLEWFIVDVCERAWWLDFVPLAG